MSGAEAFLLGVFFGVLLGQGSAMLGTWLSDRTNRRRGRP